MRKLLAICVVAALVHLFGSADSAQAQYWGGGYAGFNGYGGYYPFYIQDRIPYFAANPPVYYGLPTARSYGHSPYPYPAVRWPLPPTHAMIVSNRFAVGAPQVLSAVEVTAVQPVIIQNPFAK